MQSQYQCIKIGQRNAEKTSHPISTIWIIELTIRLTTQYRSSISNFPNSYNRTQHNPTSPAVEMKKVYQSDLTRFHKMNSSRIKLPYIKKKSILLKKQLNKTRSHLSSQITNPKHPQKPNFKQQNHNLQNAHEKK